MGEQSDRGDEELRTEVQSLAERRFLRTQAVIQDLSDSLLAINDIRGVCEGLNRLYRVCEGLFRLAPCPAHAPCTVQTPTDAEASLGTTSGHLSGPACMQRSVLAG